MFRRLDLCLLIKHLRLCCILKSEHLPKKQRATSYIPAEICRYNCNYVGRGEQKYLPPSPSFTVSILKLEKGHKTHRCVEQAGRKSLVWHLLEKLCLEVLL